MANNCPQDLFRRGGSRRREAEGRVDKERGGKGERRDHFKLPRINFDSCDV